MTTISPARIERLWAACPELRPFQMTDLCGSVTIGDATLTLFPDFAHALIRDKIVWWLANKIDCKRQWQWLINDRHSLHLHPTLACILAAERDLGLPEWKE